MQQFDTRSKASKLKCMESGTTFHTRTLGEAIFESATTSVIRTECETEADNVLDGGDDFRSQDAQPHLLKVPWAPSEVHMVNVRVTT